MYKLFTDPLSGEQVVWRINDNDTVSSIPMDEANSDYQAYLEWVAEGNTAEVV